MDPLRVRHALSSTSYRKIKLDPAMVSAPFITTVMDIFGVVVYFVIANLLLRI